MLCKIKAVTQGLDEKERSTVLFAAEELRKYLAQCADVEFAIFETTAASGGANTYCLGVGLSGALQKVENASLDDAILIDVQAYAGFITATNPRALLIAVYRYLRELGFGFIRPGKNGETVPERFAPKTVNVNEKAAYRHRAVCIEGSVSFEHVEAMIDWLPKVAMNGYFIQFDIPSCFFSRWYRHENNASLTPEPMSDSEIAELTKMLERQIQKRGLLYHAVGHGWTCAPFHLPSTGWNDAQVALDDRTRSALAMLNGNRDLFEGCALNTNLCYSKPWVREAMADSVLEYCKTHPAVAYLHIWLADGSNNQCECEDCQEKRPSDYYIELLNEIDRKLTAKGITTRIVFLIYVDLLWRPETERLHNPDRFALMFAPITRSYSMPFAAGETGSSLPYERNHLQFPKNAGENLAYLEEWQETFHGDSFDFDYHYMWDHYIDFGYYGVAETLYEDIRNFERLGLNGLVSCQVQRAFFPTALGMQVMAQTLWNKEFSFASEADCALRAEFGPDYALVRDYLKKLTDCGCAPVLRGEADISSDQSKAKLLEGIKTIQEFRTTVNENILHTENPVLRTSWKNLLFHGKLYSLMLEYYLSVAAGAPDTAKLSSIDELVCSLEWETQSVFDAFLFQHTFKNKILTKLR